MFSQWPKGGTTLGKAQAWLMVWMAATAGAQAASLRTGLLGKLPLRFEENRGAGAHREAKYTARGPNFVLSLAPGQNWLEWRDGSSGHPAQLRTQLIHADPAASMEPDDRLPGTANYFIGHEGWRTGVPGFGRIRYRNVYPGIDLVFHGEGGRLEYDFVLAPQADPSAIRLDLSGHRAARIAADGDLVLTTAAGEIRWKRPEIYQEVAGARQPVNGRFVLAHGRTVRFQVDRFDRGKTLVIDPALKYSTYIGGKGNDSARGLAVDGAGNVYVAGASSSNELPTRSAYQPNFGGGTAGLLTGDGFVAKFSPTGALVYLTYLGGSQDDGITALAVDSAGNAYVTGATNSTDFPVVNPFQAQFGGFGGSALRPGDAFVAKLGPNGDKLIYSTYLGGNRDEIGLAIAIDSAGNAYVTGATSSLNFPVTPGGTAFQPTLSGVGGEPFRHQTDLAPLFEPGDAFVTKLDPTGSKLLFSTYLGGTQDDTTLAIAVDSASNVYVGGCTISSSFPTTPGALQTTYHGSEQQNYFFSTGDGFITKLNATGSALLYSTYFGGTGDDCITGIAVDATGNVYMAGATTTPDLPTTAGAFQPLYHGYFTLPFLIAQDFGDGFVGKLDPTGKKLLYLSYLGGRTNDAATAIAIDSQGNAYVTGFTDSIDFPTTSGALQTQLAGDGGLGDYLFYGDAFVSVVNPTGTALLYSSFFGGNRDERPFGVAVDAGGNVYVVGNTVSTDLPVTANALQKTFAGFGGHVPGAMRGDAFYAVFSGLVVTAPPPPPSPAVISVANAEGGSTTIAPNTWTEIKGTNLSSTTRIWQGSDFAANNGQMPTALDGISVTMGGKKAFVYYISPTQINVLTPPDLATGAVPVVVQNGTLTGAAFSAQALALSPSFFVNNGGPYVLATHANTTLIGPTSLYPGFSTPAAPGETIVLYANGFGPTATPIVSGSVTQSGSLANFPVVTIGGAGASVSFAGLISPGLFQFNVTVPASASNGDNTITATYSGQGTQNGSLLTIQR
jgi:uncharacterized protein (TIGR03437 family)